MQNRKTIIFSIIILSLIGCSKTEEKWNIVDINPKVSKDSVYKKLDKQREIFNAFEANDSLLKRTSDVAYFSGKKRNSNNNKYSKLNNCRAYNYKSDTLIICIGIGNGFGGKGFNIKYIDRKFYTEPYHWIDVVNEGEIEPIYKVVYQKLTLDKSSYMNGDSLYGKIDFKCIEKDSKGNTIEHFGKGNFRTKINNVNEI